MLNVTLFAGGSCCSFWNLYHFSNTWNLNLLYKGFSWRAYSWKIDDGIPFALPIWQQFKIGPWLLREQRLVILLENV